MQISVEWDGRAIRQAFGACNIVADGVATLADGRRFRINASASRAGRKPAVTLRYMTAAKRGAEVREGAMSEVRAAALASFAELIAPLRAEFIAKAQAADAAYMAERAATLASEPEAPAAPESVAKPVDADLERAGAIIGAAERELGELSPGQCRDLLSDNTDWSAAYIRHCVAIIRPAALAPVCLVSRDHRGRIMDVMDLRHVERDGRPGMARKGWREWFAIARERARSEGWRLSVERGVRDGVLSEPCEPRTAVFVFDREAAPRSVLDVLEFNCGACEAVQIVRRYRMDRDHPIAIAAGYADRDGAAVYPFPGARDARPHRFM